MKCPKCSAVQADGRVDCATCGVVFARLRELEERAMLRRLSRSQQHAVPEPEPQRGLPPWLIAVAVVFVLVFGVIWTQKRKADRASRDLAKEGSAMLDDINNEGVKQRRRLEEEARKARNTWEAGALTPARNTAPAGLDAPRAITLLEQCTGFQRIEIVELPKLVPDYGRGATLERYPALATAENSGAVSLEKEGDNYRVTMLPSVAGRLSVSETESTYVITAGRPRVKHVTSLFGGTDSATAKFHFEYENQYAAEVLLKDSMTFSGAATFTRKGGSWRATGARPDPKRNRATTDLCP